MPLDILIEGLLFYKASPQNKITLMKLFSCHDDELHEALEKIRARLEIGALRLLESESEIQLVTAPELSEFISSLQKTEMAADTGKAGEEPLAIV